MILESATTVLLVFAALFPIVNPLGVAPLFLVLTPPSEATRRRLAARVAMNGFVLLVASLSIGSYVLAFFGITLPVVQVGGGLLVTASGWRLLNQGSDTKERRAAARPVDDDTILETAFHPLTMPLTVGPGSIATAVTIGTQLRRTATDEALAIVLLAATIGIAAVAASIYVSLRFAGAIQRLLGEAGTNVLVRLSAFILVCIGIQIVWNGVSGLVRLPQR